MQIPIMQFRNSALVIARIFFFATTLIVHAGCSTEKQPKDNGEEQDLKALTAKQGQANMPSVDTETSAAFDRQAELQKGDRHARLAEFQQAIDSYQKVLLSSPGDVTVIFKVANVYAEQGELEKAIEVITLIPQSDPRAGLPAIGQSAEWHERLGDYAQAEQQYRKVLAVAPDFAPAHRRLAFILNRQGRRHEAACHVRQLCLLGNVRQDELHSLALISDAMYDAPDANQLGSESAVSYTSIGNSGLARKRFADGDYAAAADLIEPDVKRGDAPESVVAFYGRAVAEAQDDQRFKWWLTKANDKVREFSEYWAAIGIMLTAESDFDASCHAYLQAIDRDPTDIRSTLRLHTSLASAGHDEAANVFEQRWHDLRALVEANNAVADADQPEPQQMVHLASLLEKSGRRIESIMWRSLALQYAAPGSASNKSTSNNTLNQVRLELVENNRGFPSQSERLAGVKVTKFPSPKLTADSDVPTNYRKNKTAISQPHPATLANVAAEVGLQHRYEIGTQPQRDGFTIYQTNGGGVAALDFDRDGWVDLCFAQGAADPPEFQTESTNELYRNTESVFDLVSSQARLNDKQYTIGVTAGDWNQDGFADVAFTNIGKNLLLINNGDGTFREMMLDTTANHDKLPTSLAMADVNADSLPDLVTLFYANDSRIGLYPPRNEAGRVLNSRSPLDYQGGKDIVYINSPEGLPTSVPLEIDSALTGFGIIVSDITDHPGNEIFVGNDLRANQLWVQSRDPDAEIWNDISVASGCAFGFSGAATASMGIAAADFDGNHLIDFHITNFQDQAASLYLNNQAAFQDRNVNWNLAKPSAEVLGFGTQGIDYDNDARVDLVVTNGNIEDALSFPTPFEQPNQLFANLGNQFQMIQPTDRTGYWSSKHLGRATAKLDYNRDGLTDFAITHLNENSALVENRTTTSNHYLQIELAGTDSERDAIGAKVKIESKTQQQTGWITAGDGYLAKNESVILFGLAKAKKIETLTVNWPSGKRQAFHQLDVDQRILIVENQEEVFAVGR